MTDQKTWREALWDSYATYDQKLQVEMLVAGKLGELQIAMLSAQEANIQCLVEWEEWAEHLSSELDGVLAAVREGKCGK